MAGTKVQVKKVKAYPIPATIKIGTGTVPGQIVKLTVQGFLIEFNLKSIQPGDKFEVWFEIPVRHHSITEPCVVVKLYNTWNTNAPLPGDTQSAPSAEAKSVAPTKAGASKAEAKPGAPVAAEAKLGQMMECHFLNPTLANKERIASFLNAIGRAGMR